MVDPPRNNIIRALLIWFMTFAMVNTIYKVTDQESCVICSIASNHKYCLDQNNNLNTGWCCSDSLDYLNPKCQ